MSSSARRHSKVLTMAWRTMMTTTMTRTRMRVMVQTKAPKILHHLRHPPLPPPKTPPPPPTPPRREGLRSLRSTSSTYPSSSSSGGASSSGTNGHAHGEEKEEKKRFDILDKCKIFVDVRGEGGEDVASLFTDSLEILGARVSFQNV